MVIWDWKQFGLSRIQPFFPRHVLALGTVAVHEYLSSGNLGEGKFTSEEEFIAFLRNSADSMGYSAADIDQALLKLTNDSDRDAFIRKIAEYASSDLKKRLLSMDPAKEGLNTPSDVVLKLFEEAGKDKYNSNDVIRNAVRLCLHE